MYHVGSGTMLRYPPHSGQPCLHPLSNASTSFSLLNRHSFQQLEHDRTYVLPNITSPPFHIQVYILKACTLFSSVPMLQSTRLNGMPRHLAASMHFYRSASSIIFSCTFCPSAMAVFPFARSITFPSSRNRPTMTVCTRPTSQVCPILSCGQGTLVSCCRNRSVQLPTTAPVSPVPFCLHTHQ